MRFLSIIGFAIAVTITGVAWAAQFTRDTESVAIDIEVREMAPGQYEAELVFPSNGGEATTGGKARFPAGGAPVVFTVTPIVAEGPLGSVVEKRVVRIELRIIEDRLTVRMPNDDRAR